MPFVNIAPIVAGTNGISPIFLTTVGVTGGIGVDLKNWVKKLDSDTAVLKHLAGAKPDGIGSISRSIGVLFN